MESSKANAPPFHLSPWGRGTENASTSIPAQATAVSRRRLLQRLHADDIAVMVDIPNRDRIGGIVDPRPAIMRVGLRQHVFGPPVLLGIEAHHPAAVQLAGPHVSLLVGLGFVEIDVRS